MLYNPATVTALDAMTDFVAFEKLCCDVLAVYGGYRAIVPQGVGRIDGGTDASLVRRDSSNVSVVRQRVVFHFSLRRDYEQKLWEDLEQARARAIPADLVVFVTSREVTPHTRRRLAAEAKKAYGWLLEIYDQQWLRVALDGECQRLRKDYLGIDYGSRVFHDLDSLLDRPARHPNREDLVSGAYYRNDVLHERIHAMLDAKRICLIVGKPGHGKTALSKAIGWELLSLDVRRQVFFLDAGIGLGHEAWLHHIHACDYDWVTFILDDCHRAPSQVLALVDAWPEVRHARLILVSRPIDHGGDSIDNNFQEVLKEDCTEVEADEETLGRIIERILRREHLAQRDPGPLDTVRDRCRGDLHILEFLVRAWQGQLPSTALGDVPDDAILDAVYARYLGGAQAPNRQHIAAVAALSEFEIPVVSRWLKDDAALSTIRLDSFVECFTELFEGIPAEFLRYFHSTPARYVVQAAHQRGMLAASSPDVFALGQLLDYVKCDPPNLFEMCAQLIRNAPGDLRATFFSNDRVIDAIEKFIGAAPQGPSDVWLNGLFSIMRALWQSEGRSSGVMRRILHAWHRRFPIATRGALWASVSPRMLRQFTREFSRTDVLFANEVLDGFDYRDLGARSTDLSVRAINRFLERSSEAGLSTSKLEAFSNGLDYESLGERSHDLGPTGLMRFLGNIRRAKVGADMLGSFFGHLSWQQIGRQVGSVINDSPPLWDFHQVTYQQGITAEMAREFVEGMGWDAVRLVLAAPSGPDVVAALRAVLVLKCGYDATVMSGHGVAFDRRAWVRSFMERPCSRVSRGQQPIQTRYVQFALNRLLGLPRRSLRERLQGHELSLRNWSILTYNVKLAGGQFFHDELEPMLEELSSEEWDRLVTGSDLLTLGLMASQFAPETGNPGWRPHPERAGSFDMDAMVTAASLVNIAHPLFSLRYLGRADWCAGIAESLDRRAENVAEKMAGVDLRVLEFFLWNLLTARDTLRLPALLDRPSVRSVIFAAVDRHGTEDQEDLAALCGTLHLWEWDGVTAMLGLMDLESVTKHCCTAADSKSPRLIRLTAGLNALAPTDLPAASRESILQGLEALVFPLEVPSQMLALQRVREWIATIPVALR